MRNLDLGKALYRFGIAILFSTKNVFTPKIRIEPFLNCGTWNVTRKTKMEFPLFQIRTYSFNNLQQQSIFVHFSDDCCFGSPCGWLLFWESLWMIVVVGDPADDCCCWGPWGWLLLLGTLGMIVVVRVFADDYRGRFQNFKLLFEALVGWLLWLYSWCFAVCEFLCIYRSKFRVRTAKSQDCIFWIAEYTKVDVSVTCKNLNLLLLLVILPFEVFFLDKEGIRMILKGT